MLAIIFITQVVSDADTGENEPAQIKDSEVSSKTSVRSKSGSEVSLKGEVEGNSDVKKESSKTSVKSVTSLRSKSGSKASLTGEAAENVSMKKDPSKTSVKSVASKTSVRSKSGSETSLKKEGNIAQEVECL